MTVIVGHKVVIVDIAVNSETTDLAAHPETTDLVVNLEIIGIAANPERTSIAAGPETVGLAANPETTVSLETVHRVAIRKTVYLVVIRETTKRTGLGSLSADHVVHLNPDQGACLRKKLMGMVMGVMCSEIAIGMMNIRMIVRLTVVRQAQTEPVYRLMALIGCSMTTF